MVKKKQKPGPKEDRLAIPGDWKNAVRQALTVEKPEGGWPKPRPGEDAEDKPDTNEGDR